MSRRAASFLLFLGMIGWGCAYYNGLYNANRLADDAQRATRQGRPGEARARWQEAAVKAESVAIHFPHSRYRDEALLLQGRALLEAGLCERAILPLSVVADSSDNDGHRRHAGLLLGECKVLLGDTERALQILSMLVESDDAATARTARVWRARAALARADYAAALNDLSGMADTTAGFDRASALIGLGRAPEAAIALGQLAPGGYDERRWLVVLAELGAVAPEAASTLVDSLVRRGNISPGQRARLLLADAIRWERVSDRGQYAARLAQAQQAAADSAEGRIALVRLLLAEMRGLGDPGRLPALTAKLEGLVQRDPGAAELAAGATAVLKRVTGEPSEPFPDLHRFLDAEVVRDSLGAPLLAAALFRGVQRDFAASPLAPKALLAAAMLEPDSAIFFVALVDSLYPDSPYRLAFLSGDAATFSAIEDSLLTLLRSGQQVQPPGPNGSRPGSGRRPQRPATGSRVPEP